MLNSAVSVHFLKQHIYMQVSLIKPEGSFATFLLKHLYKAKHKRRLHIKNL